MDFSIIIPVLNEEKIIETCLKNLQNLDYDKSKYEILIIDNGCTDSTVSKIKNLSIQNLKIIHEPQKGITFARQCGINHAKGRYYITTDADARVPQNWLINAYNAFAKDQNIVAITGPTEGYDSTPLQNKLFVLVTNMFTPALNALLGCNMAFKLSAIKSIDNFFLLDQHKFGEDSIAAMKIYRHNLGKIKYDQNFKNYISTRRYKGLKMLNIIVGLTNFISIKYFNKVKFDRQNLFHLL